MGLQFAIPWVLLLLWLAPVLGLWWHVAARRRERRLAEFVSPLMQRKLRPPASAARSAWQAGLSVAGLSLMIVAAARPQWGMKDETVYERGRDLVIALDVSRSMLANDVRPSRLQRAKADLLDLIGELRGDRAALLAFRHKAVLLCPLTSDHAFLRQALDAAGLDSAPRGETDIGDAIRRALEAFGEDAASHKAVILVSDGEDLTGGAAKAAEEAGKKGIPIFTVGLGNRSGSRIPQEEEGKGAYVSYQGGEVVTRLQHDTLLAIAKATRGAYVPVEMSSTANVTLGNLYRDYLRRVSARDFEERHERRRVDRFQVFLLPGILALLASAFLSRGRLAASARVAGGSPPAAAAAASGPTPPPLPALKQVVLALCMGGAALAADGGATTNGPPTTAAPAAAEAPADGRAAQRLFRLGRYAEASQEYQRAGRAAQGARRRDLLYNAAASSYRAGRYAEAAGILREVLVAGESADPASSLGLGASLYRDAQAPSAGKTNSAADTAELLRSSAEAFKDAARAGADPEPAGRDLSIVLGRLEKAREDALIEKLMQQYGQSPPSEIADRMLSGQRAVLDALRRAETNRGPSRVAEMEAASRAQRDAADLWIPLKGRLIEAATNDQQRAALADYVEDTRERMVRAADGARDLDPEATESARAAEDRVYGAWKGMAPFSSVLREDARRQTNSLATIQADDPAAGGGLPEAKADQKEGLELTRLFSRRFQDAVPEGGLPAEQTAAPGQGGSTNSAPAITAETRKKIVELAEQAAEAQEQALAKIESSDWAAARPEQARGRDLLQQIAELLPRQPPQSQQQKQDQQQQEQQPQDPQQQKQDEQQQQPQEQPQPQEQQPPQEQKQEESRPQETNAVPPQDVERLLDKALQREKQHEAEKRERDRRIPMSPSERDW